MIAKRSPLERCCDSLVTTEDYLCQRRYLQSYIQVLVLARPTNPGAPVGLKGRRGRRLSSILSWTTRTTSLVLLVHSVLCALHCGPHCILDDEDDVPRPSRPQCTLCLALWATLCSQIVTLCLSFPKPCPKAWREYIKSACVLISAFLFSIP